MLFLRAAASFLALPFVVAGVVPWVLTRGARSNHSASVLAWPVLMLGLTILLWCVRDFYVIGRGTLAPWDPPVKLVTPGLYRFSRNPMYVGVLLLLAGESLITGSRTLTAYACFLALIFHLRVVWGEEPVLERKFGADWPAYRARVRRWL